MLKDEKGHWVEILEIGEELRKRIIEETLQGILRLLESAEKLLNSEGNVAICLGLYTFAVEEYGKVLLLKKYTSSNGKVKIQYKNGFRNHDTKFILAIKNLPSECITVGMFGFDSGFDECFERGETSSDEEARWAVFYTDILASGDGIKPDPIVDRTLLKNAMRKLCDIASSTTIP